MTHSKVVEAYRTLPKKKGSLTTEKRSINWYVNKTDQFEMTQRFCKWYLNKYQVFETSYKRTTWCLNKTESRDNSDNCDNSEELKWAHFQTQFPRSVINENKSSIILLLLKRVYLNWMYDFSGRCHMYSIKMIYFLVETILDFSLNKPRLRIVLIKVCFRKFCKQENFPKMLIKFCKNYFRKKFFSFQSCSLSAYNFTKKKLLWV